MINNEKARVKLTNTQLHKLKSAMQYETRKILRTTNKNLENEELPHALFLRTRQKKKKKERNAFDNNMSMDIKHSKLSFLKPFNQEMFGALLGKLTGLSINVAVSLAKYFLTPLATIA